MFSDQNQVPLLEAMKAHMAREIIPLHVPGHKYGNGIKELTGLVGRDVMKMDLTESDDMDNGCNPTGVIKEAERLLAEAFGAHAACFLINGTTSGIQAMIMSACGPGEKIIIPRSAHKSAFNGLILSGAAPVYLYPEISPELGIPMGIGIDHFRETILKNSDARAAFIINSTYHGVASDLESMVGIAHEKGMLALADEAHGAHFYFHGDFPLAAIKGGADISAVSIHKTGGSMTQTSALLMGETGISPKYVKQVLNLTFTTSPSYVLMCSIDVARKQLATRGKEMFQRVLVMARRAREEINRIDGLYAPGKELAGSPGCHDFDESKLLVNVRGLGITGYEAASRLKRDYNIQLEFADMYNILAVTGLGDRPEYLEILVFALRKIAGGTRKKPRKLINIPVRSQLEITLREAFFQPKKKVLLERSAGEVAGEMITAYPPGIPIICPGERISRDIVDYLKLLKEEGATIVGNSDPHLEYVLALK